MVDIKPLTKRFIKKISKESIVFDMKVRSFCTMEYRDHKKGCKNHNKNEGCPPNSPYLEDFIIKGEFIDFYLVYGELDFKTYKQIHQKNLIEKNKDNSKRKNHVYSDRELGNLLYWQRPMKNFIYDKIRRIGIKNPHFYLLTCGSGYSDKHNKQLGKYSMESVGIHVFKTLENNSIDIERNPVDKIKLITLLCYKTEQNMKSKEFLRVRIKNKKLKSKKQIQNTPNSDLNTLLRYLR